MENKKYAPLSKNKFVFNEMVYKIAGKELAENLNYCSYKVTKAVEGVDVFVATICDSNTHSFIVHFTEATPDLMKVVIQMDFSVPAEKCHELFHTLPGKMGDRKLFRDKMRFHRPFSVTLAYYADITTTPLVQGEVPNGEYQYTMQPNELDAVLYDVMSKIINTIIDTVNEL